MKYLLQLRERNHDEKWQEMFTLQVFHLIFIVKVHFLSWYLKVLTGLLTHLLSALMFLYSNFYCDFPVTQRYYKTTKREHFICSKRHPWIAHCHLLLNCFREVWGRPDYSGCLIFLNNFHNCKFKRFFKTSGFCALYLRVDLFKILLAAS